MMKEQPNYYSIITADVRYDKDLSASEKLLYSEITALSNKNGTCWASNSYFSKLYGVTNVTVSRWINNLKGKGYIDTEMIYKNNSREIEKRIIRINKNVDTPINKNVKGGINKNVKENTTRSNTTSINKERTSAELMNNFEKLWELYPNKQGKKKAFNSYKKAIKKGVTNKDIQDGIVRYKKHLKQNDWLSPAHGATWFNNERWEDKYETNVETDTKSSNYVIDWNDFEKMIEGD